MHYYIRLHETAAILFSGCHISDCAQFYFLKEVKFCGWDYYSTWTADINISQIHKYVCSTILGCMDMTQNEGIQMYFGHNSFEH